MNNGYRALIRVLLTAGAFLLLPHFSFLGFGFHGTILGALGLAVVSEVVLWVSVIFYGITATSLGARPSELPLALNSLVFLLVSSGFLKLTSWVNPGLLTLSGILPALAGGLVLLVISSVVMLRRGCGCGGSEDDDESDDSGESK